MRLHYFSPKEQSLINQWNSAQGPGIGWVYSTLSWIMWREKAESIFLSFVVFTHVNAAWRSVSRTLFLLVYLAFSKKKSSYFSIIEWGSMYHFISMKFFWDFSLLWESTYSMLDPWWRLIPDNVFIGLIFVIVCYYLSRLTSRESIHEQYPALKYVSIKSLDSRKELLSIFPKVFII